MIGALERKRTPARRSKTPKSPDAGKGEIEAGDIYAVKVRDGVWVTMYCHELEGKHATMEFLEGIFPEMPSKEELNTNIKLRLDNTRKRCRVTGMDKTPGVKRIVRGQDISKNNDLPLDEVPPFESAKNLKLRAKWYYDFDNLSF